jgi:mono/diheme cytochrome c family protein
MRKALLSFGVLPLAVFAFLGAGEKPAEPAKPAKVTYSDRVAKVLNDHCVSCHRPGEVGPFSLVGYDNAKRKAEMIAHVTETGLMPPWKAKQGDVELDQPNLLSAEEKAVLKQWAEAGAPKGTAKEPPMPKFDDSWTLGKPDMTLELPKPFKLDAEGPDEYWNFVLKPDIKEPMWVQAVDVRPTNRRVVHHVILFTDETDQAEKLAAAPGSRDGAYLSSGGGVGFLPSGALGGWAPGVRAARSAPGTGFLIKPGTRIILQVHYNKSGKEEVDQTKVGLYFAKEKVTKPLRIAWLLNPTIKIDANNPAAKFSKTFKVPQDTELHTLMPHMHLLGKEMKATAQLPNGQKLNLIEVPQWDFNWQLVYKLKKPLMLPKGTVITLEAVYDNSTDNPNQPSNPPVRVRWGEGTKDEMMLMVAVVSFQGDWLYVL